MVYGILSKSVILCFAQATHVLVRQVTAPVTSLLGNLPGTGRPLGHRIGGGEFLRWFQLCKNRLLGEIMGDISTVEWIKIVFGILVVVQSHKLRHAAACSSTLVKLGLQGRNVAL